MLYVPTNQRRNVLSSENLLAEIGVIGLDRGANGSMVNGAEAARDSSRQLGGLADSNRR